MEGGEPALQCLEWPVSPLPQLVTVGHGIWRPGMRHFSRCFGLYDILFVKSGCIYMAEDDREYEVRENHLLALEPGKTHVGYKDTEERTELYWIHVQHDSAHELVPAELIPWSRVLRKGTDTDQVPIHRSVFIPKYGKLDMQAVWGILEDMIRLHEQLTVDAVLRLQFLYFHLLATLQELIRASGTESGSGKLASDVAAYLRKFESEPYEPRHLERRFHYNLDYIARCLKRHTGMSPLEYVRHIRIERARRLLVQSGDMPVKEIAAAVCIPDPNYFSRLFRQETGMSPAAYRKLRLGYS